MDVTEAFRVLELTDEAEWPEVRTAYRTLMRRSHPDMGGAAEGAARINAAYRVLGQAHREGRFDQRLLRDSRASSPAVSRQDETQRRLVQALAACAGVVGPVVASDLDAGAIEFLVGDPPTGRLQAVVGGPTGDGRAVSFELEPIGTQPCDDIHEVVGILMAELQRQQPFGFLGQHEDDQNLR